MSETIQSYAADHSISSTNESLISAREIVPSIVATLAPNRVIDIGCGLGAWLSVFQACGVESVMGIDGDYVDRAELKISPADFRSHDLTQPLQLDRTFDLAMSVEVAEHLDARYAERFVDTLVSLAPAVLFSAAIPNQPGEHHVNCQWPAYWAELFARRGYVVFDHLRPKFWQNDKVSWWYAQNMLLFVRQSALPNYPELTNNFTPETLPPAALVHPSFYLLQQKYHQYAIDSLKSKSLLGSTRQLLVRSKQKIARAVSKIQTSTHLAPATRPAFTGFKPKSKAKDSDKDLM
jgi:SAM-dependent methyltransferase